MADEIFVPPSLQAFNPNPFSDAPPQLINLVGILALDNTNIYSIRKTPGNKINVIAQIAGASTESGKSLKLKYSTYFKGIPISVESTTMLTAAAPVVVLSTFLILSDEIRIQLTNDGLTTGTTTIYTCEHYN